MSDLNDYLAQKNAGYYGATGSLSAAAEAGRAEAALHRQPGAGMGAGIVLLGLMGIAAGSYILEAVAALLAALTMLLVVSLIVGFPLTLTSRRFQAESPLRYGQAVAACIMVLLLFFVMSGLVTGGLAAVSFAAPDLPVLTQLHEGLRYVFAEVGFADGGGWDGPPPGFATLALTAALVIVPALLISAWAMSAIAGEARRSLLAGMMFIALVVAAAGMVAWLIIAFVLPEAEPMPRSLVWPLLRGALLPLAAIVLIVAPILAAILKAMGGGPAGRPPFRLAWRASAFALVSAVVVSLIAFYLFRNGDPALLYLDSLSNRLVAAPPVEDTIIGFLLLALPGALIGATIVTMSLSTHCGAGRALVVTTPAALAVTAATLIEMLAELRGPLGLG